MLDDKNLKQAWYSKIFKSFIGILVGFVLVFVSFAILISNEFKNNILNLANSAIDITSQDSIDSSYNSKLISITGNIETKNKLSDNFLLKSDNFISIKRKVEIYSWQEKILTNNSDNQQNKIEYIKTWQDNPPNSKNFKIPDNHKNPLLPIKSLSKTIDQLKINNFNVNTEELSLPSYEELSLNNDNSLSKNGFKLINDKYYYKGTGNITEPNIGDIRISYYTIKPMSLMTIFGQQNNNKIIKFESEDGNLFRLFYDNKSQSLKTLANEHRFLTWLLRIIGFIIMWLAIYMIFSPLSLITKLFPIINNKVNTILGIIAFITALVIVFLTIFKNIFILVTILMISLLTIYYFYKNRKQKNLTK